MGDGPPNDGETGDTGRMMRATEPWNLLRSTFFT